MKELRNLVDLKKEELMEMCANLTLWLYLEKNGHFGSPQEILNEVYRELQTGEFREMNPYIHKFYRNCSIKLRKIKG